MKKLYYFLLLLPLWGSGDLSAQVSVELMGKTPPQVFFTVSWGAKAPYNNKIWVLAQVSTSGIGSEERALITDVSATGATASTVTGHRGFWLETSGVNGSATVTATLGIAPGVEHFNWCVYAFDYPPNAVAQSDGTYQLRGSPPFTINDNITVHSNTFGPGTCIESITDFTYNPTGIVPAPPTIAWSSGGEASQSVLIGNAVIPVTFVTVGATSVTTSGLSNDVSGIWASPDYTVSGTPSATGTIAYTLTTANPTGCDNTTVSGTITVVPPGANQPQGSCTFTPPDVVNTFTAFPATYSASTFVTLVDERDGNNYTVVKMPDGKWWMAENLNYQKDLYWDQRSDRVNNAEFTSSTNGTAAIGNFWCPAGNAANTVTSSPDRAGCRLYGALYTYETAMMVDGKWSDESHTNSDFSEPSYGIATNAGNTNNGARSGTRGICPPNWHVPTDFEWGDMLNKVGTLGTNFNNGYNAWLGINNNAGEAGARLKAQCTCSSGTPFCATDAINDWRFESAGSANVGTDVYGFRVVPAGYRASGGSAFNNRGASAYFWSSSAYSATTTWSRPFTYTSSQVYRNPIHNRSYGFSVRCVRD